MRKEEEHKHETLFFVKSLRSNSCALVYWIVCVCVREREKERDREGGRPTHYLSETESLYISTQNPKVCESTNGKEGEWERDKSLQKLPPPLH